MLFSEDEHSEESKNLDNQIQIIKESWSRLETFISTTSSRFIRSVNLDDAINITLRDMGILSEASTAFIFLFNEALMNKTHEWCDEDVSSQIRSFQNLKKQEFPWWMEQLTSGKLINIKNIVDLPNEAKNLRELLEILNIKSMLIYPLSIDGNLAGLIGLSSISRLKKWSNLDFSLMRVSSQIISNAIQRSRMEKLIKKSEEKYRFITENINDLITIINSKLKFEYLNNKTAFLLLGYQSNEILNHSCLDFVHTKDVDQIINNFSQESDAEEFKIELRLRHKNGNWIWFESRGQSFIDNNQSKKWLVISRDISERKIAEERYKNLFDNSPNAIILINLNGIIVDSNSTTTKLFNYPKEDLINESINKFYEIFQLDIRHYFKQIFQASFKDNFPDPTEAKVKNMNGEFIWLLVQSSLMKQNNNTLIQLIFQDITEKKKIELLEEKFKEELESKVQDRTKELNEAFEQQKLYFDQILKSSQFKTEFMATMSHELRTPLNAIIGFTDLLLEGLYGPLTDDQKDFIKDIKSSAEHQFDMIQHILDISKIESGQITLNIQKFSLNNMIEQIISSLKPLYSKKNLKIKIRGLDTEKFIYADPIRFKEILLNLLSNAIKFTMEGKVTLVIEKKYKRWLFQVRDTGIGISRKDFPLIFKEFKRVDSPYVRSLPGTGLGLSLTKRLVELHGGEINFISLLGAGSTFTFSISKKLEEKYQK